MMYDVWCLIDEAAQRTCKQSIGSQSYIRASKLRLETIAKALISAKSHYSTVGYMVNDMCVYVCMYVCSMYVCMYVCVPIIRLATVIF